jgi:ketosteroid isomerase-like protein
VIYDNEAIVRNAYHTAEGNVLNIPGWIDSFTEDGVFNNVTREESYRGEHLKDVVIAFGQMFPDVHRELHQVNVMGDVVAIELSLQGTFRGPMETPAGVIQPTGAKLNIPCADFFYMRNGKIERSDCYPALNIMLKQMGVSPDFASAVKRSTNGDTITSNSIATLLLRNLSDVFGEGDPLRRRAALEGLWNEDGVFYDPNKGVYRGHDEIDRIAGALRATHPDFPYQPIAAPEALGNAGRVKWVSGIPGQAPAHGGTDFLIARDGRIAALHLFFDKLP